MSSEWSDFEIGQLCTVTSSKRIFAHDYVENGIPFYSSKDVIDKAHGTFERASVFITQKRFSDIAVKYGYPQPGDMLLSSVGNRAGIPYVIESEGEFYFKDGNVTWFKDFRSLNSNFLCYWLQSTIGQDALNSIMIGSAQKALTIAGLSKLRFRIPLLEEQNSIVLLLRSLDNRIRLLRETNATLEAIAQALFKSWFVDFDPVRAKMEGRAPEGMDEATAALFPDSFEESELGLIPKGWRIGPLGAILKLRNERVQPSEYTVSLPYVPIESISAKVPFLQEFKSGVDANSSLALFKRGDVLFGAMRPYFHKVCAAPFDGVTRTTVFTLTPVNSDAGAFSLFQAYQDSTVDYATQHSEGSTIPYAKWRNSMELMPLLLPPVSIQTAFSAVASSFVERGNSNVLQAQTLATLRDTLLPRLISGQLRLPEAETQVEEAGA